MLAKMIDKIVSLKETKTFEIGGQTYTDGHLTRIPPHVDRPEAISVSGLDGVCKLIRTELEKVGTTIMVQAKSYKSVEVMTTYLPDFSRNILYRAEADAPGIYTGFRSRIVMVAASQVGKSELELNIIGYIIDQDPGSILYVHPTIDDARKFSRLRVAPMIRDSKPLKAKVHEEHRRLLQHQPHRPDRGRKGRHHAVRTPAGRAAARSALQKGASTWNA